MTERLKLIIDRARWLRGEGSDASYLLRGLDRRMCCLGFLCRARGFTEGDLLEQREPNDLVNVEGLEDEQLDGLVAIHHHQEDAEDPYDETDYTDEAVVGQLIVVNDDEKLTEEVREIEVKTLMATIGVDVEFIGEGTPGECWTTHERKP